MPITLSYNEKALRDYILFFLHREADFGFKPSTSLREGLRKFAEWYKEFYG